MLPYYDEQQKLKELRRNLVLWGTLAMILIQIFFLIHYIRVLNYPEISYFLVPMILIGLLSLISLLKNKIELGTRLSVFSGVVTTIVLIGSVGGFKAPGVQWIAILPIVVGGFFGRKSLPFSLFLMLITYSVFGLFEMPNLIPTEEIYQSEKVINVILLSIFTTVLVYAYLYKIEEYERSITKKKNEIDNLLRVLLHDISNPLTVVGIITKKIGKDIDPKMHTKLETNYNTISDIIQEIRNIKIMDDGQGKIQTQLISPTLLVRDVEAIFEDKANEKGITLKIVNEESNINIDVNLGIFKSQILNNLISNAIKFTPTGKTVTIIQKRLNDKIIVEVRDEGEGIDLSNLNNFFSLEEKTSLIGTDGEVGTGYGLPLVKFFTTKLKGEIQVTTYENNPELVLGSSFKIILPIHKEEK